ncbi:ABC transporter permease [Paenibacillus contaminans]|uniref:Sugar ABC transporter permease n=1 Tax=Paenibacillus contaminans TaxID=450362 RepID=A0A329MR85_9BACL|nr:ABC transporter permease subunit [Paenibacillus contaminans]RAV20457.1 sugar ABC transporter permease [Paenibacillus contaminans]
MNNKGTQINYHLMMLPGMIILAVFSFYPMLGSVIAFKKYLPAKGIWGSPWVGLDNVSYLFQISDSKIILYNTLFIAVLKMIANIIVPLAFALLLNEARVRIIKRWVQTIVYLPHFMSWVLLSVIMLNILSLKGVVNQFLGLFGIEPILFLGSNQWFPAVLVVSDIWKEFGFAAIIYLAALTAINPSLYEAAEIDGASRWIKLTNITLPSILPTIVLLSTLGLGHILDAGFEQILNLYNPLVYQSGDVIDTYVYRVGLVQSQYGIASAVGLMKSVVSFVLIVISYQLAARFANYRIF